jgi:hypothetical protein
LAILRPWLTTPDQVSGALHRNWRRWTFPSIYVLVLVVAIAARGEDPTPLALYRVTLPWSALSYGVGSRALGWGILLLGATFNTLICLYVGYHLDDRAVRKDGAAHDED